MPDDPNGVHGSGPGPTIRVATATDRRYLPYAAAMAQSLAAHRAPDSLVELTILHRDVAVDEQRRLDRGADGITVRWVRMDADSYQRWGIDPDPMLLAPQYFRCLLPEVYSTTVPRVIYIDADTLVLDDLRPLWDWPLAEQPVAAAGDLVSVIRDAISHWQELGLDGDAPYFNSGVLVADLEVWRSEGIGGRVLRRCHLDRDRLLIRGRWPQYDQYGFNVVLQNRWCRLPDRWNHFPERADDHPGIVHFLGDTKPGATRTRPEFTRLFLRAVDQTGWAGWRPTPNPPPALVVP